MRERRLDLAAYLFGLVLGLGVLAASGYLDWSLDAIHQGDFAKFWAGPRALLLGGDPYDARSWHDVAVGLGASAVNWPDYGYFGWTILFLLPFALLPLPIAFAVWTIGGLALAATATWALLRTWLPGAPFAHTLVALTLVASQPARLTLLLGQWGFLLGATLALSILWVRSGRPTAAGLAATVALGKPQLFLLAAPAVGLWAWRRGQRRAVLTALAAATALAAISIVVLPQWPMAWLRDIPAHALFAEPRTTTLASVLFGLAGPAGTWMAAAIIVACVGVAVCFDPRGDGWLAVWLPLSLIVAPYTWSYDHSLLVVPLVIGAGVAARRSPRVANGVIVAGAFVLLVVSTLLAAVAAIRDLESYSAVVPLILFGVLAAATWPSRRERSRQ